MVRHAWDSVPFYRDWMKSAGAEPGDVRTALDLQRLPLVAKSKLADGSERFKARGFETRDGLNLSSTGTSGFPSKFRYDATALFQALAAGRRQRLALAPFAGGETGYREAAIQRPGGTGHELREFWEARMITPAGVDLRRRNFALGLPFGELLAGLNEFRPDVLRGVGPHAGAFLRWIHETGQRFHKPKALTYGADALPAADRRLIEEEMRIPVVALYHATEALRIGFQCEARRGFHVSTDMVAFRVVDSSGGDVAPGERGELILSNLTNRATVVLNYRLGDVVTQGSGPCPCGRTLPLIDAIDGRLEDLLVRRGGESLHALALVPQLQRVAGVRQVQVIQTAEDDFRLRVVWARGHQGEAGELRAHMATALGQGIRVSVESVEMLDREPSGKVSTVICQIARP